MSWLILSIICSTLIFVIFKLFARYEVNNLQAIVVNYFMAYGVGMLSLANPESPLVIPEKGWFASAMVLGFLFIILFQVMALVSQKMGVSVVSVAVKMSLVIPVVFSMIYYTESTGVLKITGIFLALVAVYLATRKEEKIKVEPALAWLPILLFIGSGFLDAFIKFNQAEMVPAEEQGLFTSVSFGMAAIFGIIFIAVKIVQKKFHFRWKNILGGVILGIPNYGSIYFLIRALDHEGLESSTVFPINNVGIVVVSALTGIFIFKEKPGIKIIIGIILAIISISMIAIGNFR